ncbi:MAG: hypothetical protein Q8O01_05510 [Candidatus Omnitrophota bacterium]|nr:hypothetical protein [Candidatus Omnitrophota bacterium]
MAKKKVKKVARPKAKGTKNKKAANRKVVKAKAKKIVKVKKPKSPEASLEKVGKVTHYFGHVNAAAVKLLKGGLKVGDSIYIKGHTTDFKERVTSIQLDHAAIPFGEKGQEIGLSVKSRVRQGDSVYKI